MEAQNPSELNARTFISRYEEGEFPRDFVLLAAQGFLPLAQEDLVGIQAFLSANSDPEISAASRESLAGLPPRVVIGFARNPDTEERLLELLARATEDPAILEALLRNRSTPDRIFIDLASHVSGHLQEIIVINHERLIRSPEIVEALERNPNLSQDVRRRVTEVREEFFEKKRIEEILIGGDEKAEELYALSEAEKVEFADLLKQAAAAQEEASLPDPLPNDVESPEAGSLWTRIQKMTISQRVQVALKGGRTERSILIKDRNKLVAGAVVKSPRISESEVEAFATLRNVEEEVLRIIGMRRDWMQKYPIMLRLVRNPKAPIGVVLPLINRLQEKDLKTLASDKNVGEAVRSSARKLHQVRKKS
ncbi:MAG TPA: hypothetical protein VM557_03640 [Thermoanaerobaculia bacterium]|nr:hypothetical protein [Thermoanaerobaculia bacterium]